MTKEQIRKTVAGAMRHLGKKRGVTLLKKPHRPGSSFELCFSGSARGVQSAVSEFLAYVLEVAVSPVFEGSRFYEPRIALSKSNLGDYCLKLSVPFKMARFGTLANYMALEREGHLTSKVEVEII